MTLEDSPPVSFASQCRILVPTAGRCSVSRQKPAIIVHSFAAESLVDLSVQKLHSNCYCFSKTKNKKKKKKKKKKKVEGMPIES